MPEFAQRLDSLHKRIIAPHVIPTGHVAEDFQESICQLDHLIRLRCFQGGGNRGELWKAIGAVGAFQGVGLPAE